MYEPHWEQGEYSPTSPAIDDDPHTGHSRISYTLIRFPVMPLSQDYIFAEDCLEYTSPKRITRCGLVKIWIIVSASTHSDRTNAIDSPSE